MTVTAYSRVSSIEQAANSHALEQQNARLIAAGAEEILSDVQSGSRSDRPNFRKLQRMIRDGLVTEVIATRIDRISRSLTALKEFADLCEKHKVNLKILDQQIDLSTPHGRLMLNMLGSVAEWEIDMLKSRIHAGLVHHRREGRAPGVIPFGYRRESDFYHPNLAPYQDTSKTIWEVAREIIEVFLDCQAVRRTATLMGEQYGPRANRKGGAGFEDFPRENGLKYWLKNPVLRGHTAYYYRTSRKEKDRTIELIANTHEALISPSEGAEIDRILAIPKQGTRDFDEPLPLAGLLHCGRCGRKMRAFRYIRHGKKIVRWYCSGQHSAPRVCEGVEGYRNELVTYLAVTALVNAAEVLAEEATREEMPIPDTPEIIKLLEARAKLDSPDDIPTLVDIKRELDRQIETLRAKLWESSEVETLLKDKLIAIGADRDFWYELELPRQRRMFRQFVEKIICSDEQTCEVKMRFSMASDSQGSVLRLDQDLA